MLGLVPAGDRRGLWLAVVALAAALLLPAVTGGYYLQFATKVMLTGIAAMALNLAVGFGGMVSLCHAAFFGLAGYVLALASPRDEAASLLWTLPLAVLATGAVAAAIGAMSLRTRGVYFIMVTLAFGQMLFHLAFDTEFAGGSDGLYVYTKPEVALGGVTLLDLERPRTLYLVALALTVGTAAFLVRLTRSPFGRALVAARDNERRARALGFPVYRIRLLAYAISGALTGLAGYFAAAQFGFVTPQGMGWHLSALMLVMVVLGGLGSVTGPLVGTVALLGLEEVLKGWTEHAILIEGVVVLVVVLMLPGGVSQIAALVLGPGAAPRTRPRPVPVASPPGA